MISSTIDAARSVTTSGVSPPRGCGIPTGLKPSLPKVRACTAAEFKKGLVQSTTGGIPFPSKVIASCIQHEVQDPQSAIAVTTKSHSDANDSIISSEAGLEYINLSTKMLSFNSKR